MATNNKNAATAASSEEELTETPKVPHQDGAKVTSIKKHDEPVFDDEIDGDVSLVEKAKRLLKNKRVVAGAITTAVLAGAVLVIRSRNSVEETDETPEA